MIRPEDLGEGTRPHTAVVVAPLKDLLLCGHVDSLRPAAICGVPAIATVEGVPYCSKHAAQRIADEAERDVFIVLSESEPG